MSRVLERPVWCFNHVEDDPAATPDEGPAFFFARVPTSEIKSLRAFESAGFRVTDVAVTLEADAWPGKIDPAIRSVGSDDRMAVLEIAGSCLASSRFHLDPSFPPETARRTRTEWVAAHLDGERRGSHLSAAGAEGRVDAFLATLDSGTGTLVVDLVAVAPKFRRLGWGRRLVDDALARSPGISLIRAGTQAANIGALRFYGSLGLRVVATNYVVHKHLV